MTAYQLAVIPSDLNSNPPAGTIRTMVFVDDLRVVKALILRRQFANGDCPPVMIVGTTQNQAKVRLIGILI